MNDCDIGRKKGEEVKKKKDLLDLARSQLSFVASGSVECLKLTASQGTFFLLENPS